MLSGTFPCSVQNDRSSEMVAVNGVPTVPRIWYDGSLGPFGVLPTLPENPVGLWQAATQTAIAATSRPIDRVRARYRIFRFDILFMVSALPSASSWPSSSALAAGAGGRAGGLGARECG